ncbi:hypothetical protein J2T55_002457 [Methylohalomonas lacus]|uniref:Uncharacterized protein n=1 Tax=Methylohalomonas lacus TaxID=398773 RepID=A0AAE3L2E7_9GAMM|nr:hypothetical protein [Methylohalomonas lacus]MCS3904421.1 hypothetical protein [Methylohalomonas lacus]
MKRENIDWSVLRGALTIFLIVLALSVAIGISAYSFNLAMEREYRSAQAEFSRITDRYLKVDEQEILIRDYYPRFVDLYQQGVVGGERRLDWLESLQQVTDNLKIPGLRYEIESQQQSRNQWPINTGKFQIYSSNMKISLEMPHEVDLLRLFDRLEQRKAGFFSASDCELSRRSPEIDLSPTTTNVSASCNIMWYSLKLSNGEEIKI